MRHCLWQKPYSMHVARMSAWLGNRVCGLKPGMVPFAMRDLNKKAFRGLLWLFVVMATTVFVFAGTLQYWQAWLYLGVFFISTLVTTLYLMKNDPKLLDRRSKSGPTAEGTTTQNTTVRLKTQEIQLVIVLYNFETGGLARKCRLDLDLFKNRHRKDLQQCVERRLQPEPFAHDRNQHIDRNGDPDLRLHGVLRRAIEPFDPQVLFDPFEKKLHLPAAFV